MGIVLYNLILWIGPVFTIALGPWINSAVPGMAGALLAVQLFLLGIEILSTAGTMLLLGAKKGREAEPFVRATLFFRKIGLALPGPFTARQFLDENNWLMLVLNDQLRYDEALVRAKKALEIAEDRFGPKSVEKIEELVDTSCVLGLMGRAQDAEEYATKVRELVDTSGDNLDRRQANALAIAMSNLGAFYSEQGKDQEAMSALNKALHLRANVLHEDDKTIARTYGNQAYAMLKAGKYQAAEEMARRALRLTGQPGPDNTEQVATMMNNLGDALRNQEKLDEAETQLTKALELRESCLTPGHPHFGYSYHNLAMLYSAKGEYDRSEKLFRQALEIRQKFPGERNRDLEETRKGFDNLKKKAGSSLSTVSETIDKTPTFVIAQSGPSGNQTIAAQLKAGALVVLVILAPIVLYSTGVLIALTDWQR